MNLMSKCNQSIAVRDVIKTNLKNLIECITEQIVLAL